MLNRLFNRKKDAFRDCLRSSIKTLEKKLAEGLDINIRNEKGQTLLMAAICDGNSETVNFLIARGADINARTPEGVTVLMTAIHFYQRTLAVRLVAAGADVTPVESKIGDTALLMAVRKGYVGLVTDILARGADLNHRNHISVTARMEASIYWGISQKDAPTEDYAKICDILEEEAAKRLEEAAVHRSKVLGNGVPLAIPVQPLPRLQVKARKGMPP